MSNPFVIVDLEEQFVIVSLGTVTKRIKFNKLEENENFFYELFKRYDNLNFVSKYSQIGKKDVKKLLLDLEDQFVGNSATVVSDRNTVNKVISNDVKPSIEDINENSTLIRSSTEKRFCIEDLELKFDSPADYYDLAVLDPEKVAKSNQLSYFMKTGLIVKTNFDEIKVLCDKYQKEVKNTGGYAIVDTKDGEIVGNSNSDDDATTINVSSGAGDAGSPEIAIPEGAKASGDDVASLFGEMFDDLETQKSGSSVDALLKNT